MGQDGRGPGSDPGAGQDPLRVGPIEFSDAGIAEYTREGSRVVFVPRASVERVTVTHGFTSERPIAALIGTALCLGGAALAASAMIASWRSDSDVRLNLIVVVAFLAAIGALCLHVLVRRGSYLRVHATRDVRKLPLRSADPEALRDVLSLARSRFGYDIDMSFLDNRRS